MPIRSRHAVPRRHRMPLGVAGALLLASLAAAGPACAAAQEVALASPSAALAFCQSGAMAAADIAYISGPVRTAQYGPHYKCAQKKLRVSSPAPVTLALQIVGTTVSECTLASAAAAVELCNAGGLGTFDIDYIAGHPGHTANGQGYGCSINFSTAAGGNAICK